ncbi:hypothetical protein FQN60_001031 [Etheostoma spectabile]|uniref:Uncharacterized protein n=1 Tax=Etheostoma spectabile TaxID=54343 RepID=A0A5J5D3S8_9PERO|nr:hypothetical protein FQN60_001031 [Etheostoma spectabile]
MNPADGLRSNLSSCLLCLWASVDLDLLW